MSRRISMPAQSTPKVRVPVPVPASTDFLAEERRHWRPFSVGGHVVHSLESCAPQARRRALQIVRVAQYSMLRLICLSSHAFGTPAKPSPLDRIRTAREAAPTLTPEVILVAVTEERCVMLSRRSELMTSMPHSQAGKSNRRIPKL